MHSDHRAIGKTTQLAFEQYSEIIKHKNIKRVYTIMPAKVLMILDNAEMNKLQPQANFSIKAEARVQTNQCNIHTSQKEFVKTTWVFLYGLVALPNYKQRILLH